MSNKKSIYEALPLVSVCTPTYNRRPFIKTMIKCFLHQTYPQERIEWIIIDDGTDSIQDLVDDIPNVKYFYYKTKMSLGKKRNLMHEKTNGDIIVYMDDDDYYPKERISHAVGELMRNPEALCAGSSEIYIYFKKISKMYKFGPYGKNHATAGTFAFKKELLQQTRYDDNACIAEEKYFLKDYTIPFVQLNPMKTILVFSHIHNTFDKRKMLENPNDKFVKESDKTVDDFVKETDIKQFFMEDIEELLENYQFGLPSMKPDVLNQIKQLTEQREQYKNAQQQEQRIIVQTQDGKNTALNINEVADLLKHQNKLILKLQSQLKKKDYEIALLNEKISRIQKDDKIIEMLKTPSVPVDLNFGMYLEISESNILAQINNIN
jgi:glycosyltransferase involved in cell wall biosynthesis